MRKLPLIWREKIGVYFFISTFFIIVLNLLSIYTALNPKEDIPNISLIFYCIIILIIWNILPIFKWNFISNINLNSNIKLKNILNGIFILFLSLLLIYTSIISFFSTFYLFPHPFLHILLISLIYIIGIGISILIGISGYTILFYYNNIKESKTIKKYIEKYKKRKEKLKEWIEKENKEKDFSKKKLLEKIKVNTSEYIFNFNNFIFLLMWIFPIWIFIIIPFYKSHLSLKYIPIFYWIGMIITLLLFLYWILKKIILSSVELEIYEEGLTYSNIFNKYDILWKDIKGIYINDIYLSINTLEKTYTISLKEIENFSKFFSYLIEYLPEYIFFITKEGWINLFSILDKELYNKFIKNYNNI